MLNFTYKELEILSNWVQRMITDTEHMLNLKMRQEVHDLIRWELDIYYRIRDMVCREMYEAEERR